MQRQGRIGTYAPTLGQEAQVAAALAAGKDDFIVPAFRENGVYLVRGMPPEMIYHYWAGDERGSAIPEETGMFSISITVGSSSHYMLLGLLWLERSRRKNLLCLLFLEMGQQVRETV